MTIFHKKQKFKRELENFQRITLKRTYPFFTIFQIWELLYLIVNIVAKHGRMLSLMTQEIYKY